MNDHAAAPAEAGPPEPLDDRLMALAASLPEPEADGLRSSLAYLREAWRGADHYADPAEALMVIAEAAASIAGTLAAAAAIRATRAADAAADAEAAAGRAAEAAGR